MTPDPARPWYRRIPWTPQGSPYWKWQFFCGLGAFCCLFLTMPDSVAVVVRSIAALLFLAFMSLSVWLDLLARRRHPEYFSHAEHPRSDRE